MVSEIIKRMAACLPSFIQHELRRLHYRRQILMRCFKSDEPEFEILEYLISPGDWVIDIGANIGHYTRRFSELAGKEGRVIALEPVLETFSLLAGNLPGGKLNNITLLNVAVSDCSAVAGMRIPTLDNGLKNYYGSRISADRPELQVLTIKIDSLLISHAIRLIKIDVEGHQLAVLKGMKGILGRDHPVIIMERGGGQSLRFLENLAYRCYSLPASPNLIFLPYEPNASSSSILRILKCNSEPDIMPQESR